MAIYKNVPLRKKQGMLPLVWQWQLLEKLWRRREMFLPYLVSLAVLGLLIGAVSLYANHYGKQAAKLLDARPWSESQPVIEKYPRSDAAMIARLSLGGAVLQRGEWDQAITILEPVSRVGDEKRLLRVVALQNIALARWKKGEPDAARELLKKLAEDTENPMADYSHLLLAELEQRENQRDQALKIYGELAQSATLQEVRRFAEARKQWLEKKQKSSK